MVLSFLGCIAAFFMTAWAGLCVVVTVATNDYRPVMVGAICWSSLALVTLGVAWRRLERGSRIFAVMIAVFAGLALADATWRLIGLMSRGR
jgi:hypothetical protein